MSEQTGQATGNQGDQGGNAPVLPEWAKTLPEPHQALITERRFESPGDTIAALIEAEKAGNEFKTAAEQSAEKLKGFEGKAPNWLEGLDEAGTTLIKQKGWGGQDGKTLLPDILKSYKNLETAFGADKAGRTLLLPKDGNDKEALDLIYSRLGRPENAEKYQYTPPQGVTPEADLVKMSKEMAFEAGLNQKQYEAWYQKWDGFVAEKGGATEQEKLAKLAEEQTALSKEWGAKDGPAWARKTALGQKAAQKFGLVNGEGKSIIDALENSFGYAATMKFMASIGEQMTESAGPDDAGKGGFGMTPVEAKQAYGQRQLDKEWMAALTDRTHPGHKAASEERARYLAAMYPVS